MNFQTSGRFFLPLSLLNKIKNPKQTNKKLPNKQKKTKHLGKYKAVQAY